ncbi:regulator of RNase E activity RraA [Pseudoduganella flava]|uniref:Regulator of RNase E activity RraA n=1 Tax=Pseudoduganella flava TaxID=871742 RepID=A0A562Q0L2_9BURK|nr:ribonuclease activity regulator RraA [Pseudoduganella flava]QGZ38269.1 ribonuclease activity regulator RraA [Pseudoduganella flava]TWI50194.1 regulator of RNase E activity RraA [Pseudoduganella flava]
MSARTTTAVAPATLDILKTIATSTLTTLLYKRGLRNTFLQGARPLKTGQRMVGPAYTLRYIPAREDLDGLDVFRDPRHPQRLAVEEIPPGAVLVMDCRGDASVASAGSILATRMQVRGVAGIVTDGGLRDASGIAALDIPAWCAGPSAPTNLIRHHALDINAPIGCGGVPVYPGDIMVGDDDGVVCIPAHLAEEIAAEAVDMERYEEFVLEQVRNGATIIGLYPLTRPENRVLFESWLARRAT